MPIDSSWLFIACCWIVWLGYWVAMAFATKRTVERGGFFGYRLLGGAVIVTLGLAGRLVHVRAASEVWHTTLGVALAADCVVAVGLAFSVWARVALGRNWSAEVTFKEGHELVASGPYGLVRHPIYTGLLLMGLGTAINYGRVVGFAVFVAVCVAFGWKARLEERIMSAHFPAAYADYRSRVRAIIPFVV